MCKGNTASKTELNNADFSFLNIKKTRTKIKNTDKLPINTEVYIATYY